MQKREQHAREETTLYKCSLQMAPHTPLVQTFTPQAVPVHVSAPAPPQSPAPRGAVQRWRQACRNGSGAVRQAQSGHAGSASRGVRSCICVATCRPAGATCTSSNEVCARSNVGTTLAAHAPQATFEGLGASVLATGSTDRGRWEGAWEVRGARRAKGLSPSTLCAPRPRPE